MLESIGIENMYDGRKCSSEVYKIKENVEDFVVQEVTGGVRCSIVPIVNLERFQAAESVLSDELVSNCTKEERKKIYTVVNYHPFKRMYTKNGSLCVENQSTDFFVFTLLKYNYSMVALRTLLSKRLGVSPNAITTCGTKDKRAITLQEIAVRCSFEKLFNYALSLSRNPKIKFKDLGYDESHEIVNQKACEAFSRYMHVDKDTISTDDLGIFDIRRGAAKRLGDHDGNFFRIKVSGFHGDISDNMKFYNYFGPQRFGIALNNHIIGKCILDGNMKEALDLILEDGTGSDNPSSVQRMIRGMLKEGKNPCLIISRLSRELKQTYLHSYQSIVFNQMVNKRIETKKPDVQSDKVMKDGDLVAATDLDSLDMIYLPLVKLDNKLTRGGDRKMVEEIQDLEWDRDKSVFKFFLKKSSYATVAIRELIGGEIDDRFTDY